MAQEIHKIKFIDLFAGIGESELHSRTLGESVFSLLCWMNRQSETYFEDYGDVPFGDMTKESTKFQRISAFP